MKRKLLSMLLTICMVVAMLPTTAFALDPSAPSTYTFNTPDPIEVNGITATVTYDIVSPQAENTMVTATVTLSGTAANLGAHEIDLDSTTASFNGELQYIPVKANQTTFKTPETYTFTVPASDVADLTLKHVFYNGAMQYYLKGLENDTTIVDNFNTGGVGSNPTVDIEITLESPTVITSISTYHYYGVGTDSGATISLVDTTDSTVYGPWPVVPDTRYADNWYVFPDETVPAGTYRIVDSANATWSCNAGSGYKGFSLIKGHAAAAKYTVAVDGSYATTTGEGDYEQGDTVNIYAGVRNDYTFSGWTSSDVSITDASNRNASFEMPENDVTITANWTYNDDDDTPPTYTVPVESGENSINASATVSSGTATVSVNNSKLDDLLADSNTTGSVSIDAGLKRNINTVTIPTSVIDKIADAANGSDKKVTGLEVAIDTGSILLDAKALAAVSEQATGSTVSIYLEEIDKSGLTAAQKEALTGDHADDLIIEVTIKSKNTVISDYDGGKLTVTLPYAPKEDESASGICVWHLASDGILTRMECSYDGETETVSFVTDHLSDFIVGCDAIEAWVNPFSDVAERNWFYRDVAYVNIAGLMNGTGRAVFSPHGTTTRGMIVEILYRLENRPAVTGACPFDDVAPGKYYEKAVTWAAANKIVEGYGNGRFGPEYPITREQMAAILYRYAKRVVGGFTGTGESPLRFPDADKVSSWAQEALCWCTTNGIINGNSDGTLAPQGKAERCQVAAILHRFIDNTKK